MTGPSLRGPNAFFALSQTLLAEVQEALLGTLGGQAQRAGVTAGDIADDDCDCGLLVVAPQRFYLSDSFPEGGLSSGETRSSPCSTPWIVGELAVYLMRCAPAPQDTDVSPRVADLETAAAIFVSDAYTTLTVTEDVLCALRGQLVIVDYQVAEQTSVGSEGGCMGTDLRVLVALDR